MQKMFFATSNKQDVCSGGGLCLKVCFSKFFFLLMFASCSLVMYRKIVRQPRNSFVKVNKISQWTSINKLITVYHFSPCDRNCKRILKSMLQRILSIQRSGLLLPLFKANGTFPLAPCVESADKVQIHCKFRKHRVNNKCTAKVSLNDYHPAFQSEVATRCSRAKPKQMMNKTHP